MIKILNSALFSFATLYKVPPRGGLSKKTISNSRIQVGHFTILFCIRCRFCQSVSTVFLRTFPFLSSNSFSFPCLKISKAKSISPSFLALVSYKIVKMLSQKFHLFPKEGRGSCEPSFSSCHAHNS